jgi:hypothetical protein
MIAVRFIALLVATALAETAGTPRAGGHQRPLPSRLSALKTLITAMAAYAFLVNTEPAHPLAVTC